MFESEEHYLAALEQGDPAAMLLEEGECAVDCLGHTVGNIAMAGSTGRSLEEIEDVFGERPGRWDGVGQDY